jgi:hypothetical protein
MSSSPDRHVAVPLNGTPNFSGAFVMAGAGSISAANNRFIGGATGPRYDFDRILIGSWNAFWACCFDVRNSAGRQSKTNPLRKNR